MYYEIPHRELVQLIMQDCPCPRVAAELIASALEEHERRNDELLEYNPIELKNTYAYYTSVKEAHTELLGAPKEEASEDEMIRNLKENGFNVCHVKSKDSSGIIVEMGEYYMT